MLVGNHGYKINQIIEINIIIGKKSNIFNLLNLFIFVISDVQVN